VSGETPIAILPMYDFPWTAAANDALWAAISARLEEAGVRAPLRLTRNGDIAALWRHPGLIFGQTCGYPYVTGLKDAVTLIAAPEYSFPAAQTRCTEASSSAARAIHAACSKNFEARSLRSMLTTAIPA
jgi:hypothetical protein